MATLTPLASIQDLSVITGLPATDPRLRLALKRAEGRFRLEAGHSVSRAQNDTISLSGTGSPTLLLPALNITEITVTLGESTTPLLELKEFSVIRRYGILHKTGGWPVGQENVHIEYTHGWTSEQLPAGVEDAVLEHATTLAMTFAHIGQEANGNRSVGNNQTATVGVTQKWSNAVEACKIKGRA